MMPVELSLGDRPTAARSGRASAYLRPRWWGAQLGQGQEVGERSTFHVPRGSSEARGLQVADVPFSLIPPPPSRVLQ